MRQPVRTAAPRRWDEGIDWDSVPIMYEDDGYEDMGEADIHVRTCEILRNGIRAHLLKQQGYRVFSDLNIYYHRQDRRAYFSPDTLVVRPTRKLPEAVPSYRVGEDGPPPLTNIEVLSPRSAQQRDLGDKLKIYRQIGVPEYILVDVTGDFLPGRMLLKRLNDGGWYDELDDDGFVTSQLGFRIVIEADGLVRVVHARTGKPYPRPEEALELLEQREDAVRAHRREHRARRKAERARDAAEERLRQVEAELARMRQQSEGREEKS